MFLNNEEKASAPIDVDEEKSAVSSHVSHIGDVDGTHGGGAAQGPPSYAAAAKVRGRRRLAVGLAALVAIALLAAGIVLAVILSVRGSGRVEARESNVVGISEQQGGEVSPGTSGRQDDGNSIVAEALEEGGEEVLPTPLLAMAVSSVPSLMPSTVPSVIEMSSASPIAAPTGSPVTSFPTGSPSSAYRESAGLTGAPVDLFPDDDFFEDVTWLDAAPTGAPQGSAPPTEDGVYGIDDLFEDMADFFSDAACALTGWGC